MLSVIVDGVEYSLYDRTRAVLVGHDGWGMPPMHRISERGPMQHGETDLGFRLDPRHGTLVFRLPATTMAGMFSLRDELIGIFAPQNNPVLKWDLDYGERRIACHYAGEMGMAWEQRDWAAQLVTVRLVCPKPTFYDPMEHSVVFGLGGGTGAFEIPLAIPWAIGASTLDQTETIEYAGNWYSYPHKIRIAGPIDDAVVTNLTTDEKLDFTDVTIAADDYYDIDCRYGVKTVTDSSGANKIADLTEDSDLATWHLAPHPDAPDGHNDINVEGSGVNDATEVYVQYYDRYLGL